MILIDSLRNRLKEKIVGQDLAIESMSLALMKYQLSIYSQEEFSFIIPGARHILLMGPTGSGKTFLAEEAANLLNIPCCLINAKSISQEGWAGLSFPTLIWQQFNEIFMKSEKPPGIVIIDEFDKIILSNPGTQSVDHNKHIQYSLLKYIEGYVGATDSGHKFPTNIDTRNLMFIFTGAFEGLYKARREKINKAPIGYYHSENSPVDQKEEIYEELIEFGLIPELLGRIGTIEEINPLTKEAYLELLHNEHFSFNCWLTFFKLMTMDVSPIDSINYDELAEEAVKKNIGARGLNQACEKIVNKILSANTDYLMYRFNSIYKFSEGKGE